MREEMVLLLADDVVPARRELTLQEIESCSACEREWVELRDTWHVLGELPELPVPQRVRDRFLVEIGRDAAKPRNVLPFVRRPAFRWVAQAAAVIIVAGGSYLAGNRGTTAPASQQHRPDQVLAMDARPAQQQQPAGLRLAESMAVPASAVLPDIEGRPDIRNVKFIDENPSDDQVGVSFDITSHVTITGNRGDKSLVKVLSYVVENDRHSTLSRSNAIQWVKDAYSSQGAATPELVGALAHVIQNDPHEGTRIKAVDALRSMPARSNDGARLALIEALRNDPNPAVRIKAIDALANIAATPGERLDPAAVEVLRVKASQNDENPYVRMKAAEALSQINY